MHVNYVACCGVREIDVLRAHRTPESALKAFIACIAPYVPCYGPNREPVPRDRFRYAIFSATAGCCYGTRFADYILDNKLGEVISTGYHVNPNTGKRLKVWIWTVDHDALAAWKAANGQADHP